MKDYIINNFSQPGDLSFEQVFINIIISLVIGAIIFLSYRFTHTGTIYSAKFNVSLIMLTMITCTVMTVIGNNIALSLGMVGALSIVRFRTAIKDPRDTAYIFWCIAAGICCGTSNFFVAAAGTAVIFVFLLIFGRVRSNERYLLIIRAARVRETEITSIVFVHCEGRAVLRVKNTTQDMVELIYEISAKVLRKMEGSDESLNDKLYKFKDVEYVNIVCQNDEINR